MALRDADCLARVSSHQEGQVLLMASLYSQRQASSWAPPPAPKTQAAQAVSILNPLQSRPELVQLPNIAFVSDTDVEGEVGRHKVQC